VACPFYNIFVLNCLINFEMISFQKKWKKCLLSFLFHWCCCNGDFLLTTTLLILNTLFISGHDPWPRILTKNPDQGSLSKDPCLILGVLFEIDDHEAGICLDLLHYSKAQPGPALPIGWESVGGRLAGGASAWWTLIPKILTMIRLFHLVLFRPSIL